MTGMRITNCSFENNNYLKYYSLSEGNVVFDVGAHVGEETFQFSGIVKDEGRVIAIEPNPLLFNSLINKSSKFHNILFLNYGLFDVCGVKDFFIRKTSSSCGFVGNKTNEIVQLPVVTLDGLCELLNIKHVNFLKADIEGSEIEMLEGGVKSFSDYIQNVVIACEHTRNGKLTVNVINKKLNDYGFNTIIEGTNVYGSKR
ncbi:MAG: FkbM family methyltransferase [Halanaerobiales bacterium]|nr:FkbM family methyltransferase [Halanaerobiales bacterium]